MLSSALSEPDGPMTIERSLIPDASPDAVVLQELQSEPHAASAMDVDPFPVLFPDDNVADIPAEAGLVPIFEPVNLPTVPAELSLSQRLLSWGLMVEPRFNLTICIPCASPINFQTAYGHLRDQHNFLRTASISQKELVAILCSLGADKVVTDICPPISPIPGLPLVDAIKCTLPGCPSSFVFPSPRRFAEHCQDAHPTVSERTSCSVKAHCLSNALVSRKFIEVNEASVAVPESLSNAVEHHLASLQLYSTPAVFEKISDARLKGTIFAQVGWDRLLVGVNLRDLRQTIANPSPNDAMYHRLIEAVERYYASLSPLISSLPILTARAVLSHGELGSKPFKPLQETSTLKKYSRFVALFLVFLLRHLANPIPNFPVPFHPSHIDHLSSLRALLEADEANGLQAKIHATILALLTHLSHEATLSDCRDLLTLFLVAYHLRDDAGNMTRVSAVPPNLASAQWCFRATAVGELLQKADLYGGDTFKYVLRRPYRLICSFRLQSI